MAVNIVLASGQTFPLSRDFILTSLPGSILFNALELDPDAHEIVIPNSVVTPNVMQVLVNYSQGIEPQHHDTNLILPEGYLNIPWLLYYTDSLYDEIPNRANISAPENKAVYDEAVKGNHDLVVGYYLTKGWIPQDDDLMEAAKSGADRVVRVLLLDGRVDPSAGDNDAIISAAENGHQEVVSLLLLDPRVDPSADNNAAIKWAAINGHQEVVHLLRTDPRVQARGGF